MKRKIEKAVSGYCKDCSHIGKFSDDKLEVYHVDLKGKAIIGYCFHKQHWVILNRETCEKFDLSKKNV
jgi:hypothetical protein